MEELEKKRDMILRIHMVLSCAYGIKGLDKGTRGQLWGYLTILLQATGMQTAVEMDAIVRAIMLHLKAMTECKGWDRRLLGVLIAVIALCKELLYNPTEEVSKLCNKEK